MSTERRPLPAYQGLLLGAFNQEKALIEAYYEHPITSLRFFNSPTIYLLEAVEGGVWIVDVVLVHLVRQHEQVLRVGEPYHSLDIGAGQDLGRGGVRDN